MNRHNSLGNDWNQYNEFTFTGNNHEIAVDYFDETCFIETAMHVTVE